MNFCDEFLQTERFQSKWAARMGKRSGAATARSGLKRGALRACTEGRGKLSIQTREKPTGPANSARCNQQRASFFHFDFWCGQSRECTATRARRGARSGVRRGSGGCGGTTGAKGG